MNEMNNEDQKSIRESNLWEAAQGVSKLLSQFADGHAKRAREICCGEEAALERKYAELYDTLAATLDDAMDRDDERESVCT